MKVLVTSLFLVAGAFAHHTTTDTVLLTSTRTVLKAGYYERLEEEDELYFRKHHHTYLHIASGKIFPLITNFGREFCNAIPSDWEWPWGLTSVFAEEIDGSAETLCSLVTNHIEHVLAPVVYDMDQYCGAEKRSGPFGQHVVLSAKAFVKHICRIRGEEIAELFNLCAYSGRLTAPECGKFYHGIKSIEPGNTTKTYIEEICDILHLGRTCFLDEVEQNCRLNYTKRAWEDLADAILSPCHLEKL